MTAFKDCRNTSGSPLQVRTGVRVFFEEMERCSVDIRKMAGVKIAAIGEGTKKN